MIEGPHRGRGSFLKNYLASRPAKDPQLAHHRNILEEPEPQGDLMSSMRALDKHLAWDFAKGPEFEFDDIP